MYIYILSEKPVSCVSGSWTLGKNSKVELIGFLGNTEYSTQVIPYFIGMVILENILRYKKGLKTARFNDGIMSMSHGIIMKAYE